MKSVLLLSIVLLFAAPCHATQAYLIFGQSCALGPPTHTFTMPASFKAPIPENVCIVDELGPITAAGQRKYTGIEIPLAHALGGYPDTKFIVAKYAIGASGMVKWSPEWGRDRVPVQYTGEIYPGLISFMRKVEADYGPVEWNFIWIHGEADSQHNLYAATYLSNLRILFRSIKRDLQIANTPLILLTMTNCQLPYVQDVNQAQFEFMRRTENAMVISTIGLQQNERDKMHYTIQGVEGMAARVFKFVNSDLKLRGFTP